MAPSTGLTRCTVIGSALVSEYLINGFAHRLETLSASRVGVQLCGSHAVGTHRATRRKFEWQWSDALLQGCVNSLHADRRATSHGSVLLHALLVPSFQSVCRLRAAVADRYPHLDAYTPVNEPGYDARFTGNCFGSPPPRRSQLVRALMHQVAARPWQCGASPVNPRSVDPNRCLVFTATRPCLKYQPIRTFTAMLSFVCCRTRGPSHTGHLRITEPASGVAELVEQPCSPTFWPNIRAIARFPG